jgi:hypothetical protein
VESNIGKEKKCGKGNGNKVQAAVDLYFFTPDKVKGSQHKMEQVPLSMALSFGRKATKGGIVSALGSRDKTRTSRNTTAETR